MPSRRPFVTPGARSSRRAPQGPWWRLANYSPRAPQERVPANRTVPEEPREERAGRHEGRPPASLVSSRRPFVTPGARSSRRAPQGPLVGNARSSRRAPQGPLVGNARSSRRAPQGPLVGACLFVARGSSGTLRQAQGASAGRKSFVEGLLRDRSERLRRALPATRPGCGGRSRGSGGRR